MTADCPREFIGNALSCRGAPSRLRMGRTIDTSLSCPRKTGVRKKTGVREMHQLFLGNMHCRDLMPDTTRSRGTTPGP